MSFILDALRKSENERRIDSMPQVVRAPLAVQQAGVPVWATIVIAALSAGFVAFLASIWLTDEAPRVDQGLIKEVNSPIESRDNGNDAAVGIGSNSGVLPRRDTNLTDQPSVANAPSVQSEADIVITSQPPVALDAAPDSEVVAFAAPSPTAELSTSDEVRAPGQSQIPAFDLSSLPNINELRAEGMNIAQLDLQLHVSSNNRANRFVMINGNRYREGDRLTEGGTIDAIIEQGVVVRVSGRAFLIPTD